MEIVNLPTGLTGTVEDDCIRIQQMPDGRFMLTGNVLAGCGDTEATESVGLIGSGPYDSYAAAEAAGLAWASEHCVELLHVSRSAGTEPLPEPN